MKERCVKPTESLSRIDYLQVTGQDSCEVFCGSDQEWYGTKRQRLTGCGPSAAANILFYLNRQREENCCGKSREDLLRFMEMAWEYVTPLSNGIPSTALFREKLEYYASGQNENFRFFILDIPMEVPKRPVLYEVIEFIQNGLRADTPIAFLNLDNGVETALEAWHWVTITVPFPVSWTVKMKKKQKETQDILSYHTQAAGCSDKARAKASGGRQPIEECGRTGL